MSKTATSIGPSDNGRRMSLAEFDQTEGQEGYLYELGRGVVTVVDVPNRRHLAQVDAARLQIDAYRLGHPGKIYSVAGGSDCKILLADLQTERHPDLAVYMTAPSDEADLWRKWIPEIVIEVVSPGSEDRDYTQKREEYLAFGVTEYWILDADRGELLVLRRSRGQWREEIIRPPNEHRTKLLPGFHFDCGDVFRAADAAR